MSLQWPHRQPFQYDEVATYGTPRRIVLLVKNLADKQEDLEEEAKGPAVKAAPRASSRLKVWEHFST